MFKFVQIQAFGPIADGAPDTLYALSEYGHIWCTTVTWKGTEKRVGEWERLDDPDDQLDESDK